MSKFQIALTTIFALAIVIGLALFAMSKTTGAGQTANILVWGTISQEAFSAVYKNSSLVQNKLIQTRYVQKTPATFDTDLVEALADGVGPDLIIMREDSLYKNRNRIFTIPYKSYPEVTFKQNFIEEGEMFLTSDGVLALPFIVDPMVMYWNRDMFSNSFVSQPPKYWDEVYALVNKMTKKDTDANIMQSALALGEWENITHAKEIISMLLLQAGTPITSRSGGSVSSVLNAQLGYQVPPSQSALTFYTQFTSPTSPAYTWNRSLPPSFNFFLSGKLATYVGFASEIFSIQQKNANLNFDVTYVPQIRDADKKIVFGHMYGISIVKQSKQIAGAFSVATGLVEPAPIKALEGVTNLPPVRRDLLSDTPTDPFRAIFYNSALLSHAWIDPDATLSTNTFRDMIQSITGGTRSQSDALSRADTELTYELSK